MYNLVWKDILILKRSLWIALLYGFVVVFAFGYMKEGALSAATVGVSYMLLSQACLYDDKNKSELMLISLPLLRRTIVLAKYFTIFIYAALAILSFLLAQGLVTVSGIPISITKISLEGFLGALIAVSVLMSIYLPIYFKLGYHKSKIIGMMLFFACFFLVPGAITVVVHGLSGEHGLALQNFVASIQRVLGWLQSQADWQIAGYLFALDLILLASSFGLSLRFYTRREF